MGGRESLIILGDFNVSVGVSQSRARVSGRYVLSRGNEAGRD